MQLQHTRQKIVYDAQVNYSWISPDQSFVLIRLHYEHSRVV